jgi:hypothetical protein
MTVPIADAPITNGIRELGAAECAVAGIVAKVGSFNTRIAASGR